jgi:hypothetical protein
MAEHLFLDLDGTLVAPMPEFFKADAKFLEVFEKQPWYRPPDLVIPSTGEELYIRPHWTELRAWAFANMKTVSVFTARTRTFATDLVKLLFAEDFPKLAAVCTNEDCYFHSTKGLSAEQITSGGYFYKRLDKLVLSKDGFKNGWLLANMVILDDDPRKSRYNRQNALHIEPWFMHRERDTELQKVPERIKNWSYKIPF